MRKLIVTSYGARFGENRSRSRTKVRDLVFFGFIRVFRHERMKNGKDLSGRNLESLGKSRMIFLNACFHGIPRGQIKSLIKLTDSVSYLSDPHSKPTPPPPETSHVPRTMPEKM